jgi:hypothetical protein
MLMVLTLIRVETAREIEVELIKLRFNDQSKHQRRLNRQSKYRENFGFNQLTGLNQWGIIRNYG